LTSVCPSVNFYIFDFFCRTTGPIVTRLGTNYPWGDGIPVCLNEGDSPSPRGDNSKRVKIHYFFLNLLLQTQQAKFNQTWSKLSLGEGNFSLFKKKRPDPLQREDHYKNVKMGWGHLKIFFSRTTGPILTKLGTNHP
jgi:hypothetical protein